MFNFLSRLFKAMPAPDPIEHDLMGTISFDTEEDCWFLTMVTNENTDVLFKFQGYPQPFPGALEAVEHVYKNFEQLIKNVNEFIISNSDNILLSSRPQESIKIETLFFCNRKNPLDYVIYFEDDPSQRLGLALEMKDLNPVGFVAV